MPPSNRTTEPDASSPITMPVAVITVGDMGIVTVSFDGDDFLPPPFAPPWTRAAFGTLLDALTEHRTRTVRIEVHENDGSIYTDIIEAHRRTTTPEPLDPSQPETRRARRTKKPRLVELHGSGFVPGEDITVAVVVTGTESDMQGNARALIDLDQLGEHLTEGVLLGDISGHTQSVRIS
ncbi:MAG: hypothetical protein BGN97_06890 [Microbacterium sp. 69-10]|nr:hypothetical protein [Microbacterium nanhaiense]OJU39315.1 MAG: hypothetical protein BGN97_06890 [Microbacterium sp. 69-10]